MNLQSGVQVRNNASGGGEESTFYPFLGEQMFNKYEYNYLIINSSPRGTEVNNFVFLRPNYVQQEFPFFFLLQSLGYFQTTEKLRLEKSQLLPEEGISSS